MHNYLKSGSWNVLCDVCGQKFKAEHLKKRWDGLYVCTNDFENRHVSDFLRVQKERISVPYLRPQTVDTFIGYICSVEERSPAADVASADCAKIGWMGM